MTEKFLVTTTGKAPSPNLVFDDIPNPLVVVHFTKDRDLLIPNLVTGIANTLNDCLDSPKIREALREDWITVKNEYGIELDSVFKKHIDFNVDGIADGQVPTFSLSQDDFVPGSGGGGGGSDFYQEVAFSLTNPTFEQTIAHGAGRKVKAEFVTGGGNIAEIDYSSTTTNITIRGISAVSGIARLN
jgi:hypothetical protein